MHPLLLANQLIMLAGGIDGNKRPLDDSEKWGVTLVGLGVVIAALAILVVVIMLFGKIFDQINKNQKAKASAEAEKKKPKQAPAPVKKAPAETKPAPAAAKPAAVPAVAPAAEDDEEVIAVISAVVAMMSEQDGKTYRIKSVAKSQRNNGFGGRSAWAMDGRRQNVNPF
ncbi:MAG: OadG family protein [Oscillospiraceae bacterium]|nr:OadG family protein [Oscillospiraceae bacterium]